LTAKKGKRNEATRTMRETVMLLPLRRPTRITDVLRSQEEAPEGTMCLRRERACWSKNWPANGKV